MAFMSLYMDILRPVADSQAESLSAGSLILITLAFGVDFLKLVKEETGTTIVESMATLMVILIAMAGFLFGTHVS